ncbi:MAG TPA: ABC transporter substrate-binding protein [Spirochaetia bacterium]|nr:ABC transporter substrate-binding protein [Spirochaetia bacterium]
MRRRAASLLCIAFVLCLASCVSPRPLRETSPVRIGFFADLSATGATEGTDALKGSELRVAEVNASGGIGGRQIELIIQDTKESPAEAVKAYTQLVQEDGVSVVIGSSAAASLTAVGPVAELSHVPLLSLGMDDRVAIPEVNAENTEQAGKPRAFTFLVRASAMQTAQGLAWYVAERSALKRVATLYDPVDPVCVLQARAFEEALRQAGRTVAVSVPLPAGDLSEAVKTIGGANADAVYVCASEEADVSVARTVRQLLPQVMLLGNESWYPTLASLAGTAANAAWFSLPFSPNDPAVRDIASAFAARFGDVPRPAAVAGWDAVGVVMAAVRKAGSSSPASVRDALEQAAGFKTLQGQLDMDPRTHRPLSPYVAIMQIAGGSYRTVDARYRHRPSRS